MIKVVTQPVTPFAQNCRLLICQQTNKAALIDPGGDTEKLKALIEQEKCEIEQILLTHGHLDHVGASEALSTFYDIPINGPHVGDKFWLDAMPKQSEMFNFPITQAFTPAKWLTAGETVAVGDCHLEVRFTPGHTPGHIVFVSHTSREVFVGDVLFAGSVGRTDFPGGNAAQLKASIVEQLYSLEDDYTVYSGHGPNTTIGHEKRTNPFTSGRFG